MRFAEKRISNIIYLTGYTEIDNSKVEVRMGVGVSRNCMETKHLSSVLASSMGTELTLSLGLIYDPSALNFLSFRLFI